jgi:D-alanyl-D-alanine dipeptidase
VLLAEPLPADHALLPEGTPLGPAPETPVRRAPCLGVDEPLVSLVGSVATRDAYRELGILPSRTPRVRRSVRERLCDADGHLPAGLSLVVLDGWRSLDEQRALLSHYARAGPTEGYVAAVDPGAMRPPHTTGGAVDLTLLAGDRALALGTDFDSFRPAAHADAFEADDGPVRRLRRALATALLAAGFVPYPFEWWHWSYGDDVWASATGGPALFETVACGQP